MIDIGPVQQWRHHGRRRWLKARRIATGLLRPSRERPRGCAAREDHELTPPHRITSRFDLGAW
jgi:hypothetical protein